MSEAAALDIAKCWRNGFSIGETQKLIRRHHGFIPDPESVRLVFVDLAGARQ